MAEIESVRHYGRRVHFSPPDGPGRALIWCFHPHSPMRSGGAHSLIRQFGEAMESSPHAFLIPQGGSTPGGGTWSIPGSRNEDPRYDVDFVRSLSGLWVDRWGVDHSKVYACGVGGGAEFVAWLSVCQPGWFAGYGMIGQTPTDAILEECLAGSPLPHHARTLLLYGSEGVCTTPIPRVVQWIRGRSGCVDQEPVQRVIRGGDHEAHVRSWDRVDVVEVMGLGSVCPQREHHGIDGAQLMLASFGLDEG